MTNVSNRDRSRFDAWLREQTSVAFADARRELLREAPDDQKEDDDPDEEQKTSGDSDEQPSKPDKDKPDKPPEAETRGGPQQAKAAKRQTPAPDLDEVTLEIVMQKLNAIRSGPSFRNKGVRERITAYFTELTPSERLALFAFLEGIAEIVAGHVDGDDARTPSDPDINVDMETTENPQEVEEARPQPRVVKHASQGQVSKGKVTVSSSGGTPPTKQDAFSKTPVMVVKR